MTEPGLLVGKSRMNIIPCNLPLENAVLAFSQEHAEIIGAGRTDAGVHAISQTAHFDLVKDWDSFRVSEAMNHFLREDKKLPSPGQVVVLNAERVDDEFHARFSATKRSYLYQIINRRPFPALEANRAWHVRDELDIDAMHEAAQILVGKHDFSSFRDSECQANSAVKTLDKISVIRVGELVELRVEALSFLHHQVRNITGSLKLVGTGKWDKQDLQDVLDARDRTKAGPTAPACGLYLTGVEY